MTGYGHENDQRRARDAGFGAHLLKPSEVERLRLAIEAVLGEDRDRSAGLPPRVTVGAA